MRPIIFLITSSLLTVGSISAKHWHEDEKHWKQHAAPGHDDDAGKHHAKNCFFQPADTRVITEYYEPRRRELPPGLQKKLMRTGHLPPGWERRMQPLPVVVERRLAPLPTGYSRGFIDGNVVVYSPRTQVAVDIVAVFGR